MRMKGNGNEIVYCKSSMQSLLGIGSVWSGKNREMNERK